MTGLTSARAAAERQIKDSGFTACRDEATMNKFEQFARESDTTALAIALMDATRRGQCIALNKGESVFVYESSGSGHVKIRRRGDPAEYWANKEAVFP
jgi:hypothetical protein